MTKAQRQAAVTEVAVLMAKQQITPEEGAKRLAAIEAAKSKGGFGKPSFKVTEKGGVSVYGLGKWPTTLYKSQWERLFSVITDLQEFLKANESKLATK